MQHLNEKIQRMRYNIAIIANIISHFFIALFHLKIGRLPFGFSVRNQKIIIIKRLHRARALNLNNDTLSRVFFSRNARS